MTTVSDDFNRANGALGANWTTITAADAAPTIVSNAVVGGTGISTWGDGALWTANSLTNDQYAQVDATYSAITDAEVLLRANTAGTQGYILAWEGATVTIYEMPTNAVLVTDPGTNPTSGTHTLRFEAEGTALRGYIDGVLVVSTTDATWSAGSAGIGFFRPSAGTGYTIDNFEAGDYPISATAAGTSSTIGAANASIAGTVTATAAGTSSTTGAANASSSSAPDAPTLVRAGQVYDGSVELSWTNPTGTLTGRVIEYAAEAYRGATLSWTTFEDSATTTASATVTGLTNGTRYVFRVSMKTLAGAGATGLSETGATPADRPWMVGVGAITAVTTGSTTPAYPAGYTAIAGDVAIIVGAGRPTGTAEIATPSGYAVVATVLQEAGANDLRLQAFSKVLTASEAMPSIATPAEFDGASAGMSLRVVIVRGLDTADLIDVAAVTSSSAAAATFRPTGLTTLTAEAFVLTVVATADDNTLSFDTSTSPASHQNFTLDAAQSTAIGGDHAVAIASHIGAVPAISTQGSAADPLTAAFQDDATPTDTGDFQYLRTGAGGTVFMLDSGCRTSHNEFTARIVDTWVPTGSGWTASNDSVTSPGHGTGTASIAAGDTLGVARAADIVIMKMMNTSSFVTHPTPAQFTEALEYIVANYTAPYFVNWSLIGPAETDVADYAAYAAALDVFAAAGGVFIVAGGNSGTDWPDLYMPDDHVCAYKVMGHTFAGAKDSTSSQAADQSLSAMYGSHTTASNAGDSTTATGESGTSFSAPLVAGTAVAVAAANPNLSAAQVMDIVVSEAPEGLTGFPAGYSTRKLHSNADVPGLVGVVSPPLFRQDTVGNDAWAAFTVAFTGGEPPPTVTATAAGTSATVGAATASVKGLATAAGTSSTVGAATAYRPGVVDATAAGVSITYGAVLIGSGPIDINVGSQVISGARVGSAVVDAIYIGADQVL